MPPRMRRRITTAKREEIKKEQEKLSHSIVRPFEILSDLPVSYNAPPDGHYEDVLKHPLTMKDSAVLYNSLLKSRYNYLHYPPMFRLFWLKQTAYAKKMAELQKDGKKTVSTYNKKQPAVRFDDRVPVLGSEVSARDIMVKLCDGGLSVGPHFFPIRLFIAKDDRPEKLSKKEELKRMEEANREKAQTTEGVAPGDSSKPESKEKEDEKEKDEVEEKKEEESSSKDGESKKDSTESKGTEELKDTDTTPETPKSKDTEQPKKRQKAVAKNDDKATVDKTEVTKDESTPASTPSDDKNEAKEQSKAAAKPTPPPGTSASVNSKPVPPPGTGPPTAPAPAPPRPAVSANMQSVENTIMISNLNSIARQDQFLSSLMKIVASGDASQQQINVFKGYIERARNMGPQPHHAHLFPDGKIPLKPDQIAKKKTLKPPIEKKPAKIPKPKIPKDQKLTAFQERYLNDATLVFEFVENPNTRFLLPKYSICEVVEASNNLGLSTERTDGEDVKETKDIIFSFLWVHNSHEVEEYEKELAEYERVMKEREEAERKKKEEEEAEKKKKEEEVEKKKAEEVEGANEKEEGEKEKDTEEGKVADDQKQIENEDKEAEPAEAEPVVKEEEDALPPRRNLRRPPPRNRKKRKLTVGPKKPVEKRLVKPEEPEYKFTSVSFTIHQIPTRLVPIVTKSVKGQAEVKERMEHILKVGTRLTSFYLWYQVDGKLDEELAENLRVNITQEEKKMPGIAPVAVAQEKKRKQKEKVPKAKKIKLEEKKPTEGSETAMESGPSQGAPVPNSPSTLTAFSPPTEGATSETTAHGSEKPNEEQPPLAEEKEEES